MDIVKRAHRNISTCSIEGGQVTVSGKTYQRDTLVNFSTKKTKPYTLDSVIFYLMNCDLPLVTYVEECKKQGIPQVAYLDRVSIENDISNYAGLKIPGTFIRPVYTHRKAYDIPCLSQFYYIIVPDDVSCPVNINTIASLFSCSSDQISEHAGAPVLRLGGQSFKLCDEPLNLREFDWRGVKAVFLSNEKEQIKGWEKHFYEIVKKGVVFSLNNEQFDSIKVIIKNNRIINSESIIEKICSEISL